MAETGRLRQLAPAAPLIGPVTLLRTAIVLALLAIWELLAHSGWLYRDVVPSLLSIARAVALLTCFVPPPEDQQEYWGLICSPTSIY